MDEKLFFEDDDMISVRSSKIKSFYSFGKFDMNLSEIQKKKKNNNIKLFSLNQNNNINKLIPNIMNIIPFINNIKKGDNISALKTSSTISSINNNLEESIISNICTKSNAPSKRINSILYSSLNNLEQKRHSNIKKNSKFISNKSNKIFNNIISNYEFRLNSKCQNNNEEHSSDSSSNNIDINQKFAYYNNNYNNNTLDNSESSSSYIKFNTYIPKKKIAQNSIINQKIINKSYYNTN